MTPRSPFNRPRVEPFNQQQQWKLSFWPFAEALADRIVTTVCSDIETFTADDACHTLIQHMRKTVRPDVADTPEARELYLTETAALMIGVALGRRLGPQGAIGGMR